MRRQKCTQCGTMLDITKLEKGSKFACSNCGQILVVGEAVITKRSLKDSGKAFERKAKKDEPPEVTRTRRQRAPADAAPRGTGKSKLPLFLGLGAVVVAGIVAAVLFGGGGGGEGGGSGSSGGGGGGSSGSGSSAPTADDWWASKSSRLSRASAKTLHAWLSEAKEKGYDTDPTFWEPTAADIYDALIHRDPDDAAANRHLGRKSLRDYPEFKAIWESMNEYFQALPREQKDFLDRHSTKIDEGKSVWMGEESWVEAKTMLDAFVAWRTERENNPAASKIQRGIAEASAIMGGGAERKQFEFVSTVEGPFILLFPFEKGIENPDARRQELADRGAKYGQALRVFLGEYEKRFREPLGLPAIEAGRYFFLIVLDKREYFTHFVRAGEGFDVAGDVPAFFSQRTKWAGVYAGPEKKDKQLVAGDLAHEATHQLQWYFSRDPKMKLLNYFDEWTGIWFTEGLAEFAGAGLEFDPTSGKTTFTGKPSRRIEFLKGMRDNGVPHLKLRDLVQLSSPDDFRRYVGGTWLPLIQNDEDMPESAGTWLGGQGGLSWRVLYAQSWFLAYFLNEYKDGKYRQKYLDLLMTALRGKLKPEKYRKDKSIAERYRSAYDAFVDIMELKDEKAWKELQREHDRFLKKLLRG